jgi:hypothetical protein
LRGNVTALLEAIDLMVEQQRIRAALTVIYAGIDAIASLDAASRNARGEPRASGGWTCSSSVTGGCHARAP